MDLPFEVKDIAVLNLYAYHPYIGSITGSKKNAYTGISMTAE